MNLVYSGGVVFHERRSRAIVDTGIGSGEGFLPIAWPMNTCSNGVDVLVEIFRGDESGARWSCHSGALELCSYSWN